MQTLKVILNLEIDGQPTPGYPLVKTITVDEAQSFNYEKATGTYAAIPLTQLDNVQFLILRSDKELSIRFDGQSDAGLVLSAQGLLLLVGATIDAGITSNVTVSNAEDAVIRGIGAGT